MVRFNKRNLVITQTCLVATLAFTPVYAAEQQTPVTETQQMLQLTVAQAVDMALANSPTITLQNFSVKEAELSVKAAKVNLKTTVTPQQLEDSEAALNAAQAQLQLTRQSQSLAAREQYINVLKAQHTLQLASAAVEQADRNLNVVRGKSSVGMATDTELYLAESNLRRAQITERTAQAGLETEQIKFNQLLGRDLKAAFQLVDDVKFDIPAYNQQNDTEKALASRLDVQVAKRSLELAQRNLKAADPSYTSQAQIERLTMAVDRAQIAFDQLNTRVILEVRQAILGLETARISVELAQSALDQQKKQLQVAVLRHDSGLITTSELLDAQSAANVAEVQAVQAMYDQALAVTRYLNTIGAEAASSAEQK